MAAAEVTAAEVKEKVEQQPEQSKEKCTTEIVVCDLVSHLGIGTGQLSEVVKTYIQ